MPQTSIKKSAREGAGKRARHGETALQKSATGSAREERKKRKEKAGEESGACIAQSVRPEASEKENLQENGVFTPEDPQGEEIVQTEKHLFLSSVCSLLGDPNEKTLGEVRRRMRALLKKKEKGSSRLVILSLTKVFFNLLPSYNIRVEGHKYNTVSKITSYEYMLMQEWRAFLKQVTRSRTEESYEAAAVLLPNAILFNKSMKLVGKVVKGTALKSRTGRKCARALIKIFKCDKGNRIVKILEVINQMSTEKIPKETIRALLHISDDALTKPEKVQRLHPSEMRKLSVEEKAIKKEAQLHFLPEEMKAWRGINERLLRIYLLVLSSKSVEKNYYALQQIQRLHVPGSLKQGIFSMITDIIGELKKDITPRRAAVLALCYSTMQIVFQGEIEYAFQIEEICQIPARMFAEMSEREIGLVYDAVQRMDRHAGSANLLKTLLVRGMHRIDTKVGDVVRHIMPREGPKAVERQSGTGFWEVCLLTGSARERERHAMW
ncbi:uncharacterized protein NEMAJ01_0662 [Nematocida major]|uniref:uncharacterized protein n=1 Tax=Nematocida major TaxID=1912982 RepID=UPI0020076029|nr:uncharacterized protein NEMAJ01_0662 [Nematocida major]KAH9385766.1 hypothetical protein NEMAJ01_0662 [Nematocida major]